MGASSVVESYFRRPSAPVRHFAGQRSGELGDTEITLYLAARAQALA